MRITSTTRHSDGEREILHESDRAAADYPDGERKRPALEGKGLESLRNFRHLQEQVLRLCRLANLNQTLLSSRIEAETDCRSSDIGSGFDLEGRLTSIEAFRTVVDSGGLSIATSSLRSTGGGS